MRHPKVIQGCMVALLYFLTVSANAESIAPLYKPSSRSAVPLDISLNAYGASELADKALTIGETAPDFNLPSVGGGRYQLSDAAESGPVVIIFYRGHW